VKRYTADDLVHEAHTRGFRDVGDRLVTDWVQRGLLDRPLRQGRGEGGGRGSHLGTWSEFQRQMFIREVELRHNGVEKIATLCNVPVYAWEWAGEAYVPLRQAKRALTTYRNAYRKTSAAAGRLSAKEMAHELGDPGGTREQRRARSDFVELLARMSPRGALRSGERDRLIELGQSVFAADLLAMPAATQMATNFVMMIEARYLAFELFPTRTDDDLRWARHVYVMTRAGYPEFYRRQTLGSPAASRFAAPTTDEVPNKACLDLFTMIGFVAMAEKESDPEKGAAFDRNRSEWAPSYAAAVATPSMGTTM
jgi:hypothetical protein